MTEEEKRSLVILNMLPGIGPTRKKLLCQFCGSAEQALKSSYQELCRIPGIGEKLAPLISQWWKYCNPDEEMRAATQAGVQVIVEEDETYPPLLREIHDPPICLYVLGDLGILCHSSLIAMVGSRNASYYGKEMAMALARGAAIAGWPVVSGLARGIDTMSHESTLQCGGRTIAVIGCGLGCIYPQENIPLAMRIAGSGGAVISEFPMFYRADRTTFPMRNRIISGISIGTIVVEAGVKSGSLITANQALEQGRAVFAVPGRADSEYSRGCHALIKEGALLTESFQDVINELTGLPGLEMPPKESQAHPSKAPDPKRLNLSGLELKIWEIIQKGERAIDAIIAISGEEPSCVMASLMTLEMQHLIRQRPGRIVQSLIEGKSNQSS